MGSILSWDREEEKRAHPIRAKGLRCDTRRLLVVKCVYWGKRRSEVRSTGQRRKVAFFFVASRERAGERKPKSGRGETIFAAELLAEQSPVCATIHFHYF